MLRLEFNDFQNKLKEDEIVNHHPTVHCMMESDKFIFVMKSREKWDYYTVMTFDEIFTFARDNEMDVLEAYDMFMTNYCANTLKILAPERQELIEEIEELKEPVNAVQDDITKINGQSSPANTNSKTPQSSKSSGDIVDPGTDLVNDAQDYSDFLLKFFDTLEKRVLKASTSIADELDKSYTEKTFGEFMRNLFNIVNTTAFANQVKRFIKADLIAGLTSAEAELGIDIGATDIFQDKLNQLASQQIDGYLINGKKWPGIKGVTKEIQSKVVQTVQGGINEKLSLNEIRDNIRNDFSNFSEWRAEMIARTETTRITNEGKLIGYQESGLEGEKVWSATQPRGCTNCSKICDRMDGQGVPLDQDFVDPGTMKRYSAPPGHPHCRSTIFFRPK